MRGRIAVGLVGAALLAGCGGGGGSTTTGRSTTAGATSTAAAAPAGAVELVRWPRFWATRDSAETGSEGNLDTRYYAGFDAGAMVYNGQDVVRVLKPDTGKQLGRTLLPEGRFVCAVSPRREIDSGVAVFGVGALAKTGGTCTQVRGVSTRTGKTLWSFGKRNGTSSDAVVDQRDGKVLFADATSFTVLDAKTGHPLWRRSVGQLTGSTHRAHPDCKLTPALAADAPVIVGYPEQCSSGFKPAGVVGIDLATGKKLWTSPDPRDPEQYSAYQVHPDPLDGRYLGAISRSDDRDAPARAVFVDSKTGAATTWLVPDLTPYGAEAGSNDVCTDSGGGEGLEWPSPCVFVAGSRGLFVVQRSSRRREGVAIVAVDLKSGARQWTFRREKTPPKDGPVPSTFRLLGLNAARTEFWVTDEQGAVLRIAVATGKVVGRGRPAPPLDLPRFAVVGSKFLLVRGEPGILKVKSGLDFYATAPGG